ncbi:hypothetical protein DIPPA_28252 [Diplonema papillatum]|nr:hypothetical protein DIPPA_28252 [Diplonema papillatum]
MAVVQFGDDPPILKRRRWGDSAAAAAASASGAQDSGSLRQGSFRRHRAVPLKRTLTAPVAWANDAGVSAAPGPGRQQALPRGGGGGTPSSTRPQARLSESLRALAASARTDGGAEPATSRRHRRNPPRAANAPSSPTAHTPQSPAGTAEHHASAQVQRSRERDPPQTPAESDGGAATAPGARRRRRRRGRKQRGGGFAGGDLARLLAAPASNQLARARLQHWRVAAFVIQCAFRRRRRPRAALSPARLLLLQRCGRGALCRGAAARFLWASHVIAASRLRWTPGTAGYHPFLFHQSSRLAAEGAAASELGHAASGAAWAPPGLVASLPSLRLYSASSLNRTLSTPSRTLEPPDSAEDPRSVPNATPSPLASCDRSGGHLGRAESSSRSVPNATPSRLASEDRGDGHFSRAESSSSVPSAAPSRLASHDRSDGRARRAERGGPVGLPLLGSGGSDAAAADSLDPRRRPAAQKQLLPAAAAAVELRGGGRPHASVAAPAPGGVVAHPQASVATVPPAQPARQVLAAPGEVLRQHQQQQAGSAALLPAQQSDPEGVPSSAQVAPSKGASDRVLAVSSMSATAASLSAGGGGRVPVDSTSTPPPAPTASEEAQVCSVSGKLRAAVESTLSPTRAEAMPVVIPSRSTAEDGSTSTFSNAVCPPPGAEPMPTPATLPALPNPDAAPLSLGRRDDGTASSPPLDSTPFRFGDSSSSSGIPPAPPSPEPRQTRGSRRGLRVSTRDPDEGRSAPPSSGSNASPSSPAPSPPVETGGRRPRIAAALALGSPNTSRNAASNAQPAPGQSTPGPAEGGEPPLVVVLRSLAPEQTPLEQFALVTHAAATGLQRIGRALRARALLPRQGHGPARPALDVEAVSAAAVVQLVRGAADPEDPDRMEQERIDAAAHAKMNEYEEETRAMEAAARAKAFGASLRKTRGLVGTVRRFDQARTPTTPGKAPAPWSDPPSVPHEMLDGTAVAIPFSVIRKIRRFQLACRKVRRKFEAYAIAASVAVLTSACAGARRRRSAVNGSAALAKLLSEVGHKADTTIVALGFRSLSRYPLWKRRRAGAARQIQRHVRAYIARKMTARRLRFSRWLTAVRWRKAIRAAAARSIYGVWRLAFEREKARLVWEQDCATTAPRWWLTGTGLGTTRTRRGNGGKVDEPTLKAMSLFRKKHQTGMVRRLLVVNPANGGEEAPSEPDWGSELDKRIATEAAQCMQRSYRRLRTKHATAAAAAAAAVAVATFCSFRRSRLPRLRVLRFAVTKHRLCTAFHAWLRRSAPARTGAPARGSAGEKFAAPLIRRGSSPPAPPSPPPGPIVRSGAVAGPSDSSAVAGAAARRGVSGAGGAPTVVRSGAVAGPSDRSTVDEAAVRRGGSNADGLSNVPLRPSLAGGRSGAVKDALDNSGRRVRWAANGDEPAKSAGPQEEPVVRTGAA